MDGITKQCTDCGARLPLEQFKTGKKKRYMADGTTKYTDYRLRRCINCQRESERKRTDGAYSNRCRPSFIPGESMTPAERFFFCGLKHG